MLGDFTVNARAEEDTSRIGPVDVVIVAVKAYDNASALPMVEPLLGPSTTILPLQNGVDTANELAERFGEQPVLGGVTYIATALVSPGVIEQTGTHRRIHQAFAGADITSEPVEDGRVPIWEKFIFLVSLAGFTGASRLPIGPLLDEPSIKLRFLDGCREIEALARAEGVPVAPDIIDRISSYVAGIPGSMRSSLLIDLSQGKPIEVEQLHGSVVRRAEKLGVPVPITSTLYAVLKPWAAGARRSA
jgi:2-dehydropantoate 2-reductase